MKTATRPAMQIAEGVGDIETWSPIASDTDFEFEYIDIASIDREQKVITTTNRTRAADAPSRARQIVQKGDVLVSTVRPGLNAVAMVPESLDGAIASTGFTVLRCDERRLHGPYLFHWVRSTSFVDEMVRLATGASYPAVSDRIVKNSGIPIPFPDDARRSLAEQKRIAAILDKADAIRRRRQEAARLADTLIPSVFYEMFGDVPTNRLALPRVRLGEILKVSSGDFLPAVAVTKGPYPVYGGNGVNGWHAEFNGEQPRIVIGRVGYYCGAVHVTPPKAWVTDNALYVSACNADVDRSYLTWALRLRRLNQFADKAAQPLLSGRRIYEVEILKPASEQQTLFAHRVGEIERCFAPYPTTAEVSDTLFNSLVQRAFRGEL